MTNSFIMNNIEKKKQRKYIEISGFVVGVICFCILLVTYVILPVVNRQSPLYHTSWPLVLLIVLSIALIIYYASRNIIYECICIFLISIMCLFGIFNDNNFSLIDEAAHYDYINYIVNNCKLPTMNDTFNYSELMNATNNSEDIGAVKNYEAVQGPIYYVAMALITGWISNVTYRLYAIRFIGYVLLLMSYFLSRKILCMLQQKEYLSGRVNFIIPLILFMFNPGIIIRTSRVSNECLAIFLSVLILYLYVRLIIEGFSYKNALLAVVLCVLLFLTKSTNIYWLGGIFLICLYYKQWKMLLINIGVIVVGTGPWFIHNYSIYSSLTGMDYHIAIVKGILAQITNDFSINYLDSYFNIFFSSFLYPDECGVDINNFSNCLLMVFNVAVWLTICVAVLYTMRFLIDSIVNKKFFEYTKFEKKNVLFLILVAEFIAFMGVLAMGSYSSGLNAILGRYLYTVAVPIIIIFLFIADMEKEDEDNVSFRLYLYITLFVMLFAYATVLENCIYTYANKICSQREIVYSPKTPDSGNCVLLEAGHVYQQVFTSEVNSITGIKVKMGTSAGVNTSYLTIEIYSLKDSNLLYQTNYSLEKARDYMYETIRFDESVSVNSGEQYIVSITINNVTYNSVVLFEKVNAVDERDLNCDYAIVDGQREQFDWTIKVLGQND